MFSKFWQAAFREELREKFVDGCNEYESKFGKIVTAQHIPCEISMLKYAHTKSIIMERGGRKTLAHPGWSCGP